MVSKEKIISRGNVTNFDEFLTENRKAINRQFAIAIRILAFLGPVIAVMVKLHMFMGVTFNAAIYITVYVLVLAIIHGIILRRNEDSIIASLLTLLAFEGLLLVINSTHLTIYRVCGITCG